MENKELQLAWQLVSTTDTHIFLTGRAGTGKTTFLRELRMRLPKRMVVLAPTGIAAINAQGTTIHSFFQLPLGPHVPGMKHNSKHFAFKDTKKKILRSIDLLVIDEISMVRADVLDAVDEVLRRYRDRSRPFGGVQLLMIGDMQQLPPVARNEDWTILKQFYSTPYFFSSHALSQCSYVTVELQHVYRQSDPVFIDLLNKVRTNTLDAAALALLNCRYRASFTPRREEGYIRLTTHNHQAEEINQRELALLRVPLHSFKAEIEGDFPDVCFPTDAELHLKVGAQVMFIKNDSSGEKRYYNGMIAEVVGFDGDVVHVISNDTGSKIDVGRERWENTRYDINEKTKEITETVVGYFEQYPLKTAWAITVHKSQGLTFAKAIVDVHQSFAHGQTYVALSRCKSLDGLVLSSPIPQEAIINDNIVTSFTNDPRHQQPDAVRLVAMQRQYLLRIVEELFAMDPLRHGFTDMMRFMREYFHDSHPKLCASWSEASEAFRSVEDVARRFHSQYERIIMTSEEGAGDKHLQERLKKGAIYFAGQITPVGVLLNKTVLSTNNKMVKERRDRLMTDMREAYRIKHSLMVYVGRNGFSLNDFLKQKSKLMVDKEEPEDKPKKKKKK